MVTLEVDRFTAPQAREEFQARYDQIVQVVGTLSLQGVDPSEAPAQAYGGGAFVLQGIDAYVPSDDPFDFEAVVGGPMFDRIAQTPGFWRIEQTQQGRQGVLLRRQGWALPIDLVEAGPDADLSWYIGPEPYTGSVTSTAVETDAGILATSAATIAQLKTAKEFVRVKDLAGIVKAHVVAVHTEHAITKSESWRESVALAIDRLTRRDIRSPLDRKFFPPKPKYPGWLKQLVKVQFDHPAFENLPRL
jgi:hypothetical protein